MCPSRSAVLLSGLTQDQLPPAECTHEALCVQRLGMTSNPEMEKQILRFHTCGTQCLWERPPLSSARLLRSDFYVSISEQETDCIFHTVKQSNLYDTFLYPRTFPTVFSTWFLPLSFLLSV